MTDNTINFTAALAGKNKELHYQDDKGDIWYPYGLQYSLDNREFECEIWARSDKEAENVLLAMQNGKITGRIYYQEEVNMGDIDFNAMKRDPHIIFPEDEQNDR